MKYESLLFEKIEATDNGMQDYFLQKKVYVSLLGIYKRSFLLFFIVLGACFAGYFIPMPINPFLSLWLSILGVGISFFIASICLTTPEKKAVVLPFVFSIFFGISLGVLANVLLSSFLAMLMYIIILRIMVFFITLVVRTIFINSTISFVHVIAITILSLGLFFGCAIPMRNGNIGNISFLFDNFVLNFIVLSFVGIYSSLRLDTHFLKCEVAVENQCLIASSWRLSLGVFCSAFYL